MILIAICNCNAPRVHNNETNTKKHNTTNTSISTRKEHKQNVSTVRVPDDAPPAPHPPSHSTGTAPIEHSPQTHRHTHHTASKPQSINAINAERERHHRQTDRQRQQKSHGEVARRQWSAAKLVSRVRVPDDAQSAPTPSHSMSWAPTSTQQPADTAHHRASKPHNINAINAERQREKDTTDRQTNSDNKKAMARRRAGGWAQQSWCPGFESRTTHSLLPPHHTACHGHRQAHSPQTQHTTERQSLRASTPST
eukprot:SAG31_NODE_1714_length_7462_cov_29.616596_6_plen_252_part_01